ncbi:MAG: DMT family transporter [Chitinophagaceae bacterium]|nr:DMT family transporter [Chitinophagaceae bacterium]
MQDRHKAHLALLGANLFYGAGFTVAKTVMPSLIAPNGFILIRVVVATVLFWLSFFGGDRFKTKIERKDWKTLILCALFGVATNQLLFFQGLSLTSPIHASLMMLSTPILVSVFAAFILKESLTPLKIAGLIIGVAGAAFLVTIAGKDSVAKNPILGDFFVFLNATSYAIYLIMVKPLMTRYRPIIVIRWVFLIGSFMVFPFGIKDFVAIDWSVFQTTDFMALAFIVICVTFFTYLWNIYALRILSPSTAGAYIYLQPLFAAIIAILFLHEPLSWMKGISAVLIFTGVYLVGKKKTA